MFESCNYRFWLDAPLSMPRRFSRRSWNKEQAKSGRRVHAPRARRFEVLVAFALLVVQALPVELKPMFVGAPTCYVGAQRSSPPHRGWGSNLLCLG
jgi:hypothetical protein